MPLHTALMTLALSGILSCSAFGETSNECATRAKERIARLQTLKGEQQAYTGKKQSAEKLAYYDHEIRLEKANLQAYQGQVSCASAGGEAQPSPVPYPAVPHAR